MKAKRRLSHEKRINMASGDTSNSACASTGASPNGTTAAGTGNSASAPKKSASNALVPHEATTVTGGEGTEPVVIPDEDDEAFTGESVDSEADTTGGQRGPLEPTGPLRILSGTSNISQ
ncbi:hypothetical protein E2562_000555 [Oryza meyeriana var. granulata]|uniref:Uncharacterized protein n=1 Tax=Oryza meyeriana var. granulata TaxID=110450 RepID=A0A6G1DUN1_9ORYZ|nr:hypothetical protein E2562_000555 [Oryza meyeriana var. granulata]